MTTVSALLTWGQWLTSPGFGGAAAVVAAVLALIGVRRANAGLAALTAITQAHGFDQDELNFVERIAGLFLEPEESGTLEAEAERREEGTDGSDRN